jgi:hypothetical protein
MCLGAMLTVCAINACSTPPTSTNEYTVDGVNEYAFDFVEGQPGAVISFHSSILQKCTLSFAAKNFAAGFKASASRLGEGGLDILCIGNDGNYILSPKEPTSASMEVVATAPQARVRLDFNLYNPRGKTWQKAENIVLQLNANQTQALQKNN